METRVQKWGNSLALRIPRSFADQVQVKQESLVDISIEDGALVVRPISRRRPRLAELLEGVTESNLHGETDWGEPCGREEW